MRRAVFAVALFVAACGDRPATPVPAPVAAPAAAPIADAPFEATFDDAQLEARILDAARTGKFDGLSSLKLPPRCDRVRVAVRALHDVLLGVAKDPPPNAALLSALDALAKCKGGASAKSLGPLVAAWRGWGDTEFAAERDLAGLAESRLAGVRGAAAGRPAGAPSAATTPPMSPAAAQLQSLRVAEFALEAKQDAVSDQVAGACAAAQKLFNELGWPGGFGTTVDALLPHLLQKNSKSFLAAYFADMARASYARSGDELRASLVFLAQADAADRDGDVARAERAAAAARERLLPTGARGAELVNVLRRHGELAQKAGKQVEAARDLSKAWDEAKWAGLAVDVRVQIAEPLATSLFRLGRFVDAFAVARDGAKLDPSRVELDEIAAESASELGRGAEAAELYRGAAARGDPSARDRRLLFAARALAKGGDADGAAKIVADVLSRPVAPPLRVFAASVLREAGRLEDADHELYRVEAEQGSENSEAVVAERARLFAAKGDAAAARRGFGWTVDRLTKGDPDALVGWDLAQLLLDWARVETGAGRLYEASELAGRAIIQLRGSGLEWELDRARKLYVDLQRWRGWFLDAEKATTQRLAAQVGDLARREDVTLDLLFVRIELLLQRKTDAEKNARAAAAMFPDDWRRELATDAVEVALGHPLRCPPNTPSGLDERSRWGLLRDVVAAQEHAADVAERCGAAEPELRRWALSRRFGAGHDEFLVEMRRRADPTIGVDVSDFVNAADEAVLLVEPIGDKTIVRLLLKGRVLAADAPGDAGLADFWDATWVAPSPEHIDAAAKRVSAALFPAEFAKELRNVRRLWISVPEPLGPLPFDMLTCSTSKLLTNFDVLTVSSLTELSRCRAAAASKTVATLSSPYASVDARNAIVQVGGVDDKVRARFLSLVASAQRAGSDACSAVRNAKSELLSDCNREGKTLPGMAPWAAFLLRGAP